LSSALTAGDPLDLSVVISHVFPVNYKASYGDVHIPAVTDFDRLEYNSATGNYTLHFNDFFEDSGTTELVYEASTLNTAEYYFPLKDNPNFTSYTAENINPNTQINYPSELYLYKIGSSNSEINLTCVSFGVQIVNPWIGIRNLPYTSGGSERFFIYGVPTLENGVPKTGAATYNGVVYGSARTPAVGIFAAGVYDIFGTSALTANFANGTLTTSMTFTGDTIPDFALGAGTSLVVGVPSTTVSGTGSIGSPGISNGVSTGGNAGTFFGNFNGETNVVGTFSGRFYGPNAEEFGYNFLVKVGGIEAAGVTVGKK
jgi:hypothetical protein